MLTTTTTNTLKTSTKWSLLNRVGSIAASSSTSAAGTMVVRSMATTAGSTIDYCYPVNQYGPMVLPVDGFMTISKNVATAATTACRSCQNGVCCGACTTCSSCATTSSTPMCRSCQNGVCCGACTTCSSCATTSASNNNSMNLIHNNGTCVCHPVRPHMYTIQDLVLVDTTKSQLHECTILCASVGCGTSTKKVKATTYTCKLCVDCNTSCICQNCHK